MDYFSLLPAELIERILCSCIAGFDQDEEEDDAEQGDVRADVLMLESVQESCKPFSDYVVPKSTLDQHLTPRDLISFALTCKRHCQLVLSSGQVWKGAFSRQYPVLAEDFSDRQLEMDWMRLMKDRRRLESAAKSKVEAMSDLFYHKPDLSDGDYADLATLEEAFSHEWLLDALRHILNKEDNLTTAYYGNKALKQLQFAGVVKRMEELLRSEKPDTQIYEEGMIMLAECFQPEKYISKSVVKEFVDEVEQEVRKQLALQLPQHPSLKPDMPIRTKKEQIQVLDCLNSVLYGDMGVRGNSQNYYDLRNVFVDEVVGRRTGMPISLCVIYLLCADRLGIECSGVNYPSHFVLACKSPSSQEGDDELYFIDAFESGRRLAPAQLTDGDYEIVRCGPRDVFFRILRNLLNIIRERDPMLPDSDELNRFIQRRSCELFLAMRLDDPEDALVSSMKKGLSQVYLELHINHDFILENSHLWGMQPALHLLDPDEDNNQVESGMVARVKRECQAQLAKMEENKPRAGRQRPPVTGKKDLDVMYTVGMIMRHRKYNYDCVISGWDHKCKAERQWITYMGVHRLRLKEHQPFYHVLVSGDGSNRYAAQENLKPLGVSAAMDIDHPEVGKHFVKREGGHYKLNPECAQVFPEDDDYRAEKYPE